MARDYSEFVNLFNRLTPAQQKAELRRAQKAGLKLLHGGNQTADEIDALAADLRRLAVARPGTFQDVLTAIRNLTEAASGGGTMGP